MKRNASKTYRALGWFLTYPEASWVGALPEMLDAIRHERALGEKRLSQLEALATVLRTGDLIEGQEHYVALFDRSRRVSLYLFEHVHGDSRDRGTAMVNLRELYASTGLLLDQNELPDFLPMYLEYLSLLPAEEARRSLCDVGPILQSIHARLAERNDRYEIVLAALLDLAGLKPAAIKSDSDVPDDTPEALDQAWEDAPVTFGPENDPTKTQGCNQVQPILQRMLELDAARREKEART